MLKIPVDIPFATAADLRRGFRDRTLSPVEVIEALLNRIKNVNPLVNAYCTLSPEVARRAALAAERRFMGGHPLGALDGVPFSLKDLTPTRGIRTTYGSKVFEYYVPDHDGLVAERLLAAGGVLLGKTNTPEFGGRSITDNRIFGPTRNPWDLSRVAGGSSGGAAAAVATGMGPVAHGSDSPGSIRIPAAACGVVGLRPTVGRVAVYPTPNAWQSISVDGPLARTVRDTALLFGAMCGRDKRDPLSLPGSSEDFVAANDRSIQGLRVAWTSDLGYLKVDPIVAGAIRTAAEAFNDLGCEVEENCHGLLVDFQLTHATGTAERDVVPQLLYDAKLRGFHPRTLGADKAYDARACVAAIRQEQVTPHVAQNTSGRRSAIDQRTTRHPGYAISQRVRKRVEEVFGWLKSVGGFRRTRYRGLARIQLAGYLVATAYNLVRMARLLAQPMPA